MIIMTQGVFSYSSSPPPPFYEVNWKGINWFGFESNCRVVHGLWTRSLDSMMNFLDDYNYNALRIPFAYETIKTWDSPTTPECLGANLWMVPMTTREIFHLLFTKAADRGIWILLDFHSYQGKITPFPYVDTVLNKNEYLFIWKQVIHEFHGHVNFLGIDIKNEPHGSTTWEGWLSVVESVVTMVTLEIPEFQGYFIVEGIEENMSNWGGSFRSFPFHDSFEFSLPGWWNRSRMILSPHLYGVSVRGLRAMEDTTEVFEQWFGFLSPQFPICIGEFGGWYVAEDAEWQQRAINYLLQKNITTLFYWSLNPESEDTGGLFFQDWQTVNEAKLQLHEKLQPYPTLFTFSNTSSYMI